MNCVRRVVSGCWQETTGSASSCLAVSSSAPVRVVRVTRLGQNLVHALYISVRFSRFRHYPVLACRVLRVSVSASFCCPTVRVCRFVQYGSRAHIGSSGCAARFVLKSSHPDIGFNHDQDQATPSGVTQQAPLDLRLRGCQEASSLPTVF